MADVGWALPKTAASTTVAYCGSSRCRNSGDRDGDAGEDAREIPQSSAQFLAAREGYFGVRDSVAT